MTELAGKTALVTGASQGIGRAIARALAAEGVSLILAARSRDRLDAVRDELVKGQPAGKPVRVETVSTDLADPVSVRALAERIGSLDVLIHCGGMYASGTLRESDLDTLRQLLATNVEGPAELTRHLLPTLAGNNGDVIFINSSIVTGSGAGAGHFAATQRALQAVADALRAEVNELGVRVLSVYPGRTATPRQATIHEKAGHDYRPERLLQPEDIASAILACLRLPATAEVTDLYLRQRHKA